MNCPRCKAEVSQQDKYCPSCGFPLEAARSGNQPKKGPGKKYEEASTQLVDVDEFKKYMANDSKAAGQNLAAGESLASGGNLAQEAAKAAPVADPMQTRPQASAPAPMRMESPAPAPAELEAGGNKNIMVLAAVGVIILGVVAFLLMK